MNNPFKLFIRIALIVILLCWAGLWLLLAQPDWRKSPPSEATVSPELLEKHVRALAEDFWPRNGNHIGNMKRTADYIENEFKEIGVGKVVNQWYESRGRRYRNVSLFLGDPKSSERIVIGAHYDAYDYTPGADDNASGVSGLIELARLFSKQPPGNQITIEFVAYPLEEPPYYGTKDMGSWQHADALKQSSGSCKYMVSLEMIGYFSDKRGSQKYPIPLLRAIYPGKGNYITVVGNMDDRQLIRDFKIGMRGSTPLPVHSISGPKAIPGIDFSDHRNYWKAGFTAIMITDTAFYRNVAYHTPYDTPDRLNYDKMAQVVIGGFEAIHRLEAGGS